MTRKRKTVAELRSQRWFSAPGATGVHKHRRMKQGGFAPADYEDKPVIGILSTWSDFNTCHAH
ncbi:MAG: dihydroxy-acid dehydratase, partial [Rhizobiales bacterium]|nr:dihydroxy-acid dehydratase [Hyphomicrobiales bacterium]